MGPSGSWFARLWTTDKRKAKRKESIPLAAYYWDGEAPSPRQVRDISPSGMYLLTEQRWYPNTLITMMLTRSDMRETDPGRSVKVTARVVRAGDDGVGFSFIPPSANRDRDRNSKLMQEADVKMLTAFLAKLRAETGRAARKSISLAPPPVEYAGRRNAERGDTFSTRGM